MRIVGSNAISFYVSKSHSHIVIKLYPPSFINASRFIVFSYNSLYVFLQHGLISSLSGKVLNLLGADIHDNDIYFLDGTRRLLANILNDNKNNKALIIDT